MPSSKLDRVGELFGRLVALAPPERQRILDELAHDEQDIRREVEHLLSGDRHAASRLAGLDRSLDTGAVRKCIGRYELDRRIGGGGMGVVYKAHDPLLSRTVAIKILHRGVALDEYARIRFEREAQAASRLAHRNICRIYEFGQTEGGEPFLVMPLYLGATLRERIVGGKMEIDEVLSISLQLAHGLSEAHSRDVVHRDIKPGNVLLSEEGDVVILDFGLAMMADLSHITRDGSTMGTVAYMSPEQISGGEVDSGSDLWSLGVVMYEMLTGRLPFRGDHDRALIFNIREEDPESPAKLRSDVPIELDRLVMGLLVKEVAEREADPLGILERLVEERGTPELVEIRRRHRRQETRKNAWRITSVVAASALILWGASALWRSLSTRAEATSFDGRVLIEAFVERRPGLTARVGHTLASLLESRIDGAGSLDAVGLLDAPRVGQNFQVRIAGEIIQDGPSTSVVTRVHVGDSVVTISESAVADGEDLGIIADRLALRIIAEILDYAADAEGAVAAQSTSSLQALRAYLAGRAATAQGRTSDGVDMQIEAVTTDSTFAMAWYGLSRALNSYVASHELDVGPKRERRTDSLQLAGLRIGRTASTVTFGLWDISRHALAAAHRHSQRLPERFKKLIEALNSSDAERLEIIRMLCDRYPEDQELLYRRAMLTARIEGRISEAWTDLAHAASIDLFDSHTIAGLMNLATVTRDFVALDTLLAEYLRRGILSEDFRSNGDRVLARVLAAGPDDLPGLLTELEDTDVGQIFWATETLASSGRCDLAVPLASVLRRRQDWHSEIGSLLIARCSAARGRLHEAASIVLGTDHTYGDGLQAMVAMVALFPSRADSATTQLVVQGVENWDYERHPIRYAPSLDEYGPAIKKFYLDMLRLHQGVVPDTALSDGLGPADPVVRDLRNTLLAYVLASRGEVSSALRVAEAEKSPLQYPYNAWLRAELYRLTGRHEEALRQYNILLKNGLAYLNDWLDSILIMRIAECYDGLEDVKMAVEYYRRFLMYWVDSEPAYQHLAHRAKWRLESLSGEPASTERIE